MRLYHDMHGELCCIVEYREMDTKSLSERDTVVILGCNTPIHHQPISVQQTGTVTETTPMTGTSTWRNGWEGGEKIQRVCSGVRKTIVNYKDKKETGTGSRIWMQFMWILLERAQKVEIARKQHNKDSLSEKRRDERIKSVEDGNTAEWNPEASGPVCLVLFCNLQGPSQIPADCAQSRDGGNRPLEDVEMEEPLSVTRPLTADWHLGRRLVSCCFSFICFTVTTWNHFI